MVAELAVRAGPVRARRVVGRVSGATGAASPADSRTGLSAGCAQNERRAPGKFLQPQAKNIGLRAVRAAHGPGAAACTLPAQPPH